MTTSQWTPENQTAELVIAAEKLDMLLALSPQYDLDKLPEALTRSDQQWLATAIHWPGNVWARSATDLDNEALIQLIKILAAAEMQVAGCAVGEKSPVIDLNRLLKDRGQSLGKADLLWLREHSNNRFLPNGPIL